MGDTKRVTLTVKTVERLAIPDRGRVTVYDSKVPELGLRIDANRRKSYFWFKSANGAHIFRALGTYPAVSIDTARTAARDLQGTLEKWRATGYQGANPFDGPETEPTFQELLDAYVAKRVAGHASNPARAKKEVEWMVNKYLSAWTGKRLSAITDKDVRKRHKQIADDHGRVIADRVVQLTRRLYQWAIEKEKLYAGPNPAKGVEFYGCGQRERFLSGEELARLFTAMKKEPNRDLVDFINLSLWTGARRGDTLSMRWSDISIDDNVWRVPTPKGGKPYLCPLVPEAIEVLKHRQRVAEDGAVYVFPSTKGFRRAPSRTGHLVEMKRGWTQLLDRAKIEDLHIHDLRRSLASWQAGLGYSLPIIGKTLGHKPGSSATSVYARLDLGAVRGAMGAAVGAMVTASKQKPKATRKPKPARGLLTAGKEAMAGA